ncbi:MAG: hypothetical protein F6K11_35430 [Leptolyngbya sp. SIO3F4]|nr:hypothetical protein [Leptolyngbya sp. SIO3F4]
MTNKLNLVRTVTNHISNYRKRRNVDDIISLFDPTIAKQFDNYQWQEIRRIIDLSIAQSSPKIVDLRFTIDLIFSRFYFTLFVGKDRRRQSRSQTTGSRVGNFIAAICLLIALNLLISLSVVIVLYLIKSALGIDLMPGGHFSDLLFKKL